MVEVVHCRGYSLGLAVAVLAFVVAAFVEVDFAFAAAVVYSAGVDVSDFADPIDFDVVSVADTVEEVVAVAAASMDCMSVLELPPGQDVVDFVVVAAAAD